MMSTASLKNHPLPVALLGIRKGPNVLSRQRAAYRKIPVSRVLRNSVYPIIL